MNSAMKLGRQMRNAFALDLPPELVALVATTSHPKRLQDLFMKASERLLQAHREARQHPTSLAAQQERARTKGLVDLLRGRIAVLGLRKPTVIQTIAMLDVRTTGKVIDIRKAA